MFIKSSKLAYKKLKTARRPMLLSSVQITKIMRRVSGITFLPHTHTASE